MMPYDKVIEVIDDAISLGASRICLSGGEPFMNSNLARIVEYVYRCNTQCIVYTSGIIWYKGSYSSISAEILKQLKEGTKLIINYEASNDDVYNRIMGTNFGGYKMMRETIQRCVELGIPIETHVVPMPINYEQLIDIVQQCEELGVDQVSFLRIVPQGRALEHKKETVLPEKQYEKLNCFFKEAKQHAKVKIRLGIPLQLGSDLYDCKTGIAKLNVRYDGLVYPCEAFKNDLPEGFTRNKPENVFEKRLTDIYENSAYLHEIRERLTDFHQIKSCESCMNQYYRKKD